ncbi:MAG: tetratricopeptide repeat protein [Deltaproteobacteria bacterium]|nr:tetratricopeptide repeat protein [Deltaproteobacteria bacterium]
MKIVKASVVTLVVSGLVACSDAGENTNMGAAAGGALGAGLGAIIGNQTGSTGGGLVIGAVAGAAAGGAIGNMLDGQENTIRTQDEAIERHERTIQAQRTELEELRKINQEQASAATTSPYHITPQAGFVPHASFGRTASSNTYAKNRVAEPYERKAQPYEPRASVNRHAYNAKPVESAPPSAIERSVAQAVQETTLVDHSADYVENQDVQVNVAAASTAQKTVMQPFTSEAKPVGTTLEQAAAPVGADMGAMNAARMNGAKAPNLNTPECTQAEGEVNKAAGSAELADKLFHYRRALRLCPDNPAYHNGLGEIYLSLNRRNDAEFEFREALNLDPQFQAATNNLNSLR